MLQTDWQEQTEKQKMEVELMIYDAEYYLLCSIGAEDWKDQFVILITKTHEDRMV